MATSHLVATSGTGIVTSVTVTGDQAHVDSAQLEIDLELDDPLGGGTYSKTVVVSAMAPHQLFAAMTSIASWACASGAPVDVVWKLNPGFSDLLTSLTVHGPEDAEIEDGEFAES
jgi:hypothetical protein